MLLLQPLYEQLLASIQQTEQKPVKSVWGKGTARKAPDQGAREQGLTSKVANMILSQGVEGRASDIHLEQNAGGLKVRYRIDGILYDVLEIEAGNALPVIARIKVIANLPTDMMSTRRPMDGRFTMRSGDQNIDFRVSTFPTIEGEKMVIRILQKDLDLYCLERIGLHQDDLLRVARMLKRREGLILVTGPTGCGKTTTLYAILNQLNSPKRNILTLEDPVEYRISGINQCDIQVKAEFDFAEGLKAALRQDPDIIFVGEVRDSETAEIALRASLTGHLVLSTLHANSAVGTMIRLINMGLQSHLVTYSLIGSISQRLVRKICTACRRSYTPNAGESAMLQMIEEERQAKKKEDEAVLEYETAGQETQVKGFFKGEGCPECGGTGYKGRLGLFEIVMMDNELRDALLRGATTSELQEVVERGGTRPIVVDGVRKARQGLTTLEEVFATAAD